MSNSFSTEILFARYIQGTGYRKLSLDSEGVEVKGECLATLRGIDDLGLIDGLVKDMRLLVLSVTAGTPTTKFSVEYVPSEVLPNPDNVKPMSIGEIDIANQDASTVIGKIRNMINQKFGAN